MDLSEQCVRPTFGGHEKFVFRHGWLKKGVDGVKRNPLIFTHDEALVELGVGKNMVRSIRHWCLATELVQEMDGVGLAHPLNTSMLGEKLLGDRGWDPFLEDIGSLWLLHWQLTNNLTRGFVGHILFSKFLETEFTKRQLANYMGSQFTRNNIHTTQGTIDREIDVCLRTYVPAVRNILGAIADETLDCPLAELDIVRFIPNDNIYRFNIGPKISLPLGVFGYTLLSFLSSTAENRRTIAVDDCIYQEGSPGQVFKLDENSLMEFLELLEKETKGKIRLEETTGLRQVYLDENIGKFEDLAFELLREHYEQ
ncbi:MAG: DUF4007 family protein [Anaerolineaceae bacterium]|nr:DUF4007 family protein [Anaerolineaceae bacterium]MBN2678369.1 DUF4007 family protein [Anaerolineaceae bacterium]